MPDPLQPILSVPLETYPDGSYSSPMLEFAPDGKTLYVRQAVMTPSISQWIQRYGPDIAGALLLIVAIFSLIALRRVLRSPRERGKVFCRRCNYKLTPPLVSRDERGRLEKREGVRCPECGADLARMCPAIGRGSISRLWAVWGIALPLIAACIFTMWLTLQRYAIGTTYGSWPVPGLQAILGGYTLQKTQWWQHNVSTVNRITRWSIPDGKRIASSWMVDTYGYYNGRLSTDGSAYLNVVVSSDQLGQQLLSIDTATGARHAVDLTPITCGADIIGFSPDGRLVYIQTLANRQTSMRGDGEWTSDLSLRAFDIRTFDAVEIARQERPLEKASRGWETPYHRFVIDPAADPVHWALVSCYSDASRKPMQAEIVWFDGKDKHDFTVPAAGTGWYEPKLLDGGKTLEVNFYGNPASTRIDLATGTTSSAPSTVMSNWGGSLDGRWRMVPGLANFDIIDTRTGAAVATLNIGKTSSGGGGVISRDGRYLANTTWDPNSFKAGKPPSPVIQIWELPPPRSGAEK